MFRSSRLQVYEFRGTGLNARGYTIFIRGAACNFFFKLANCFMRVLSRFMAAATDVTRFPPPTLPEIAFLGRSNVGKSSVINSLLGSKVARTSSTPGRTQSINFFEVRWPGKPAPELIFADLPGYGYARVPRAVSSQWAGFIEPYIQDRPTLVLCVALVDLNVPAQPVDKNLLEFLQAQDRPFLIVGTKSDKLSGNQARNALNILAREFSRAQILSFSAKTGAGREELWRQIRAAAEGCSADENL